MTTQTKTIVSAAKAFARKKHGGLSARFREMLDVMKPGIAILVTERLSLADIKEFCQENGLKIGMAALRQYCQENFNYPPRKRGGGTDS